MKFCGSCGNQVEPNDRFCTSCGSPNSDASISNPVQATDGALAPPPVVTSTFSLPPTSAQPTAPQLVPAKAKSIMAPSRKVMVLAGGGALVIVLALVAFFTVENILRGGADSPAQAAEKVISSISNKDLVGVFTMVTPRERNAVQRTEDALLKKYQQFDISDAVSKVSGKTSKSGLDFSGITISITGTHPRVTAISDDLAAVTIDTGEITWSVDPSKIDGVLRTAFAGIQNREKKKGRAFVADLVGGHGVTLMANKVDGRWYISPLLSVLDLASSSNRTAPRGIVPAVVSQGAESPAAAAQDAAKAVPLVQRDGLTALAPYLTREEAQAVYLYGLTPRFQDWFSGNSAVTLGDVSFTNGPEDGDRAVAFVDHVSWAAGSSLSDRVTLSSKCVTLQAQPQKRCLNGSGFSYGGMSPLSIYADQGKFAVTTVKEDGFWKVSLLDTVADHAVSWVNSITKEQALSILDLTRATKPASTLALGTASTVRFNSAGYAVVSVIVPEKTELQMSQADAGGMLYSSTGKTVITSVSSGGSAAVEPGTYTLVLRANSGWLKEFENHGNTTSYSTQVKLSKYVEPATIDGSTGTVSGVTYNGHVFEVQAPTGNNVDLTLNLTKISGDAPSGGSVLATVDAESVGKSLVPSPGEAMVIPLPSDGQVHDVIVYVDVPSSSDSLEAEYTLSFTPKQ